TRTSNTPALYETADALGVLHRDDEDMTQANLPDIHKSLGQFIGQCDYLYRTIDLDVFPAATAPGDSAPAARGVSFDIIEPLL
ncbi:formimidoylglutamase, partial [Photobacterium ganghwense]